MSNFLFVCLCVSVFFVVFFVVFFLFVFFCLNNEGLINIHNKSTSLLINLFMPSGFIYLNSMDPYISNKRVVWQVFYYYHGLQKFLY